MASKVTGVVYVAALIVSPPVPATIVEIPRDCAEDPRVRADLLVSWSSPMPEDPAAKVSDPLTGALRTNESCPDCPTKVVAERTPSRLGLEPKRKDVPAEVLPLRLSPCPAEVIVSKWASIVAEAV